MVITKDVTFVAVYSLHKCAAFTDISDSWAKDDICYVTENDLFNGTSATTFTPNATMTRAMLITVLYRMSGSPAVTGTSPFTDVTPGTWYTNAVIFAANKSIAEGTSDTTFSPNDPITREQLATILYNYAVYCKYDVTASSSLTGFTDVGKTFLLGADSYEVGLRRRLDYGHGFNHARARRNSNTRAGRSSSNPLRS